MTFKRGINSKHDPQDFVKSSLRSIFSNYATDPVKNTEASSVEAKKEVVTTEAQSKSLNHELE